MIHKLARLFEITVRELAQAGHRIGEQSQDVALLRLWMLRHAKRARDVTNALSVALRLWRPCDLQPTKSASGRIYWVCNRPGCGNIQLHNMSKREQWRAGIRCKVR